MNTFLKEREISLRNRWTLLYILVTHTWVRTIVCDIQLSAVITRPNVTWYCIQSRIYWSRTSIRIWIQLKRHTIPRASYVVTFGKIWENIDRAITVPQRNSDIQCDITKIQPIYALGGGHPGGHYYAMPTILPPDRFLQIIIIILVPHHVFQVIWRFRTRCHLESYTWVKRSRSLL